jgi:hypothetical protein
MGEPEGEAAIRTPTAGSGPAPTGISGIGAVAAKAFRHLLGLDEAPCDPRRAFHLARFLILRLLGLVYLTAFAILISQGPGLLGSKGLLPVGEFVARAAPQLGGLGGAFARLPSLFWFGHSDALMAGLAWTGAVLAVLVVLGVTNAGVMATLWALYMSFVHVGQDWYGYGWEIQLLETGFLAIFLCPLDSWSPFPTRRAPPIVMWLFRWLIFRIMIGAGLIKIRGDACWRDLTCLYYHYETQPNPTPLARALHFEPHWMSKAGVIITHVVELGLPWLLLFGRWATRVAGVGFVLFQFSLIASGNLSFLNWLTIVPAVACFDDAMLGRVLPSRLARRAAAAERGAAAAAAPAMKGSDRTLPAVLPRQAQVRATTLVLLTATIAWLSIPVVANLLSGHQVMNTSYGPLDLVNTYGAFGSVGRERREIVFEGTTADASSPEAEWREYPFRCAPCDPARRPCLITPYHYRLDWQIWFAAMSTPSRYPWTLRFVWKLLHNDPVTLGLLAGNPFPDAPPRFVRARLYVYRFAPLGSGRWWDRELIGDWIPPLSRNDPRLIQFLKAYGWLDSSGGPVPR